MAKHFLKEDPENFQELWNKTRNYEIRRNDRGFAAGDEVFIRETLHSSNDMAAGAPLSYTGRAVNKKIKKIRHIPGLQEEWCVLDFHDSGDFYLGFSG